MVDKNKTNNNAKEILKMFSDFGIELKLHEAVPGPTSSYFTFSMETRIRMKDFKNYLKDLQYTLGTSQISIEAPMQDQSLIRIEVVNKERQVYEWKDTVKTKDFKNSALMKVPLGYTYGNKLVTIDITKQPHLLISGTVGSGKSTLLNVWVCSLLTRLTPKDIRFIIFDPKLVEFPIYNEIPHLLTEVITAPKNAVSALRWITGEMENRYKLFAENGVHTIENYNILKKVEPLPYLIFIADELADLMVFSRKEAEELIIRIVQLAKATGIHFILATQRPCSDVLPPLMRANIPARIAFNTACSLDSKIILDFKGAEYLLGIGDGLYLGPTDAIPVRFQGLHITEDDIENILKGIVKKYGLLKEKADISPTVYQSELNDPFTKKAIEIIIKSGYASASMIQRALRIGYARAARILDELEEVGYLGPAKGSKPREILNKEK